MYLNILYVAECLAKRWQPVNDNDFGSLVSLDPVEPYGVTCLLCMLVQITDIRIIRLLMLILMTRRVLSN